LLNEAFDKIIAKQTELLQHEFHFQAYSW